ncbi:hypothetical protein RclHR1_12950002 [Rhizophagus clarus]|uniref:Uncharacterized protein n=1 Tax=Rhizophagus clarus TaxID=94130 RepID=A0A2Z6QP40_9GLOM|nr:hypothetical protein RclHR1_12950002 [Rhizophagus clarus]
MTRSSKKHHIASTKSHATNGTFISNETKFKKKTREIEDFLNEDWGDDDDNEWKEDIDLTLVQTNYKRLLELELWTKAAKGTSKLTNFFSSKNKEMIESDDILTDDEWNFKEVEVKIKNLKEELKRDQYRMSVIEYNKKRAIFEMLKRVKENEKGLIKISVKAAELVFIDSHPYKV